MEKIPDIATLIDQLQAILTTASDWVQRYAFVVGNVAQVVAILIAFLVAWLIAPRLIGLAEAAGQRLSSVERYLQPVLRAILPLALPLVWLALLWLIVLVAGQGGWPHQLVTGVVSLLTAWVVIRLAAGIVRDPGWSRAIAMCAWTVAALNIVGLLGPTVQFLDNLAFQLGDFRVSVYSLGKAVVALAVLLWLANAISGILERRINVLPNLTPSLRVLFGKLMRIGLFAVALIAALNSVGIDLSAFAIFGGAVGVGLGFGLQKVVSNLVSGIILLLDRSVKPGDVIAVGGTYGWINSLGARYVSVITRDGIEHLIPNEELISQRVENWSYSDNLVRLRLPIGVAYDSDIHKAIEVAVEAAKKVARVLSEPKPLCQLRAFGADSVDLELRIWIRDPQNGVGNVCSEVLLHVWDLFRENGIEFPFAQRDLHLKSSVPLQVEVTDVR